MGRYLTQEDYDYIVEHISESMLSIAKAIGHSDKGVVRQVRRIKAGLPFEPVRHVRRMADETEARIRTLRNRGHSIPCIAHQVQTSEWPVRRIVGSCNAYSTCGCLKAKGIRSHNKSQDRAVSRQIECIGALHRAGKSVAKIVSEVKLPPSVVERRITAFYKLHPEFHRTPAIWNKVDVPTEAIRRMVSLLLTGRSQREVSIELGLSTSIVSRLVSEARARKDLPLKLTVDRSLVSSNASKPTKSTASGLAASLWTPGRDRYLSILRKHRTVLDFMPDELNREFPHLPRVTVLDVRNRLYGASAL